VEEVVDRVDPRLRAMTGYRSRLAPALESAVHVADALVNTLPEPIPISRREWSEQPLLRAYFASADSMQEVFDSSVELRDFLTSARSHGAQEIYGAVGMRMDRKTTLQIELHGEVLRRDQQRTAVSFSDHRLGVFALDQQGFRKALRRRILEEVAARAMQRIMGLRTQRDALAEEQVKLQWKLKMYQMRRDGIGNLWHDKEHYERHIADLQGQLGNTSERLDDLLGRAGNLEHFLDATVEAFEKTADTIQVSQQSLRLDPMNLELPDDTAIEPLNLCAFKVGRRSPRYVQLVRFSPDYASVDAGQAMRRAARSLGVH
jgi:hypothetical protein